MNTSLNEPSKDKKDFFYVFDLVNIFPGHKLLVNVSLSIISLLSLDDSQEHAVIAQRLLTESEMRVLLPLLDAPACCQPEVLQASYACTYEFLLQAVFSPDVSTSKQWNELVQQQRERLDLASAKKDKRAEMKGVYNALFGLRQKLEPLGLTIRVKYAPP
jgi:hypothetical protein